MRKRFSLGKWGGLLNNKQNDEELLANDDNSSTEADKIISDYRFKAT